MNLTWRIWESPVSFLSSSLKQKYFFQSHIWQVQAKLISDRSAWKFLIKAKSIIINQLQWVVGNGSSISFWNDRWCGHLTIRNMFIGPLEENSESLFVSHFINENSRTWRLDSLQICSPSFLTL